MCFAGSVGGGAVGFGCVGFGCVGFGGSVSAGGTVVSGLVSSLGGAVTAGSVCAGSVTSGSVASVTGAVSGGSVASVSAGTSFSFSVVTGSVTAGSVVGFCSTVFSVVSGSEGGASAPQPVRIARRRRITTVAFRLRFIVHHLNLSIQTLPPKVYADDAPKGERGYTTGFSIVIHAKNTRTIKETAKTLVHEVTHSKYGIGGSLYSEAVCFAREHIHEYGSLTNQDMRNIIKTVKCLYPEYEWRKGGRNKWKK